MANYKVIDADQLDSDLTSVADSIRTKGGTTAELAFPEEFKAAIEAIETGGGGAVVYAPMKAVNFRDYDGTVLYSYTAEEAVALTELPPLPTQPGLVCQEWNWSLSDMQTYVSQYGRCEVGATYITDDGKTRLYISVVDEPIKVASVRCSQSIAGGVTVDWGDGSAKSKITYSNGAVTFQHTYASLGDYVVTMEVANNCTLSLGDPGSTSVCVMGSTANGDKPSCNMLRKIEVGERVTSLSPYVFYSCRRLASVTIPSSVTSIGTRAFCECYSLKGVTIPNGITSVGEYEFSECRSLESIALPNSVESIGKNAMANAATLSRITIPNSVEQISEWTFNNCSSLVIVTIPSSVMSIGTYAFYTSGAVRVYDFTSHTSVPALAATNAFTGIYSKCEIRVPAALADEWKAATNWSTYASKVVGV